MADRLLEELRDIFRYQHRDDDGLKLLQLEPFKVVVFGNGRQHTWTRFGLSLQQAQTSAIEAIKQEYPADGQLVSVEPTTDPRDSTAAAERLARIYGLTEFDY